MVTALGETGLILYTIPMKIAQVVSLEESVPPNSKNGLEFVVSWLTEGLVQRGHEVTLFASGDSDTKANLRSLFSKSAHHDPVQVLPQPLRSIWNAGFAAATGGFDVIHDHSFRMVFYTPFITVPVIETVHEAYKSELHEQFFSQPHATAEPFITDQFKSLEYVTVSKRQEELFQADEPYYFKKHRTIYNGIPVESFTFNDTPKDYLLYLGYINHEKGADTAVRVAMETGVKLILAGHVAEDTSFFDQSIKPFLSDLITYVGPADFAMKNELYRNAVAMLSPLHWEEPFGLTLVESQACGTPVVALRAGASSEVIVHGTTGFVVDTEEEMIEAVQTVSSLKRADCRAWVAEQFTVEKMIDGYEELYRSLVAQR